MDSQVIWSPGITLDAIEKQIILIAFRFYRGNKTHTANALGIAVRTLDNKLAQYKVDTDKHLEKEQNERAKRESELRRHRGPLGDNLYTGQPHSGQPKEQSANASQHGVLASSGVRMESVANSAEKPSVSVSERKEIQGVSPAATTGNGSRSRS